jgi:predicted RNase H-like HicB family nuclease
VARHIYPAIFDPSQDGGYTVTFPDLPGCVTEGDDLGETLRMAAEAMALYLYCAEEDGDEIPTPSEPAHVSFPEDASDDAFVTLVVAGTEPVRDEIRNRSVKKTLTIPQWLNEESEKAGVNFSQILQSALKERLGLIDRR